MGFGVAMVVQGTTMGGWSSSGIWLWWVVCLVLVHGGLHQVVLGMGMVAKLVTMGLWSTPGAGRWWLGGLLVAGCEACWWVVVWHGLGCFLGVVFLTARVSLTAGVFLRAGVFILAGWILGGTLAVYSVPIF